MLSTRATRFRNSLLAAAVFSVACGVLSNANAQTSPQTSNENTNKPSSAAETSSPIEPTSCNSETQPAFVLELRKHKSEYPDSFMEELHRISGCTANQRNLAQMKEMVSTIVGFAFVEHIQTAIAQIGDNVYNGKTYSKRCSKNKLEESATSCLFKDIHEATA